MERGNSAREVREALQRIGVPRNDISQAFATLAQGEPEDPPTNEARQRIAARGGALPPGAVTDVPEAERRRDVSTLMARGATLNLSEELEGLLSAAIPGGEGLAGGRARGEARTAAARERLGSGGSLAAEIAGGGLLMPLAALTAPRSLGVAGRIALGAGEGAGAGAIASAADAQSAAEAVERGVTGGLFGAGVGVAIPAIAGASDIARSLGITRAVTPRREARRTVEEAIEGLGLSPEGVASRGQALRRARPGGAVMADLDEALSDLVQRGTHDIPAPTAVRQQFAQRSQQSAARLRENLRRITGVQRGTEATAEVAERGVRDLEDRLFTPLQGREIDPDAFESVFQNRTIRKAWDRIRGERGLAVPRARHTIQQRARGVPFSAVQELRDELSEQASRAASRGQTQRAARFSDAVDQITTALDDQLGGQFSAASRRVDSAKRLARALRAGEDAVSGSVSLEQFRRSTRALEPNELDNFRVGFVNAYTRKALDRSKGVGQRVRELRRQELGQKLRDIFESQEAAEEFYRAVDAEDLFERTGQAVQRLPGQGERGLEVATAARQFFVQGPQAAALGAAEHAGAFRQARARAIMDILLSPVTEQSIRELQVILAPRSSIPFSLGAVPPAVEAAVSVLDEGR